MTHNDFKPRVSDRIKHEYGVLKTYVEYKSADGGRVCILPVRGFNYSSLRTYAIEYIPSGSGPQRTLFTNLSISDARRIAGEIIIKGVSDTENSDAGSTEAIQHFDSSQQEDDLVTLKTKSEIKQDIQNRMFELYRERQALSAQYRENIKRIDDELADLDYKLLSGSY